MIEKNNVPTIEQLREAVRIVQAYGDSVNKSGNFDCNNCYIRSICRSEPCLWEDDYTSEDDYPSEDDYS